jgi:hypothetical protein
MKSVIELVKTTQGYSIVEDNIEVNKVSGRPVKEKHYNSAPKSIFITIEEFTPQNFTIYPYVYCH